MGISSSPSAAVAVQAETDRPVSAALLWTMAGLFVVPALLIVYKLSALPGADSLSMTLSLSTFAATHERAHYVLFVPLGAAFIVMLRLVLGIRILGPFRSILLAIAFQVTGSTMGVLFLALVIGVIVALRPLIRRARIPYFGRVSTILGGVSIMIIAAILVGQHYDVSALQQAAYFPIVVLTLTGDGFARTLNKEGLGSALWRGLMTTLAALAIAGLATIDELTQLLIRFPEITLATVGAILVVSKFFAFRLLQSLNPPPAPKRRVKGKQTRKPQTDDLDDELI